MQYLITFIEGIISFISPCMLPMLPVYVSYFAGSSENKKNPLTNAVSFVLGFTLVFCLYGFFAGSLGSMLVEYQSWVNIVCGIIIIFFGFNFLGVIRIPVLHAKHNEIEVKGVFSAFLFGMVFSVSHTPCVGAFLGSALTAAAASGGVVRGVLLLLTYSVGMGIPFILAALLIDKLAGLFNSIKKNYTVINAVCGFFLVIVGVFMMLGWMNGIVEFFETIMHHSHHH